MRVLEVDKKKVWSWILYDFGQTVFSIVIVTFIYATYFTQVVANPEGLEDNAAGVSLWSFGVSATALIAALLSPVLGAYADRRGRRKRMLLLTTAVCILFTALLYFPQRGDVALALVLFVIANIAFELTAVFYNAFLPDIAGPETMGRVSAAGWTAGFLGGLVVLGLNFALLTGPAEPFFGWLDVSTHAHLRVTALLTAAWFLLFSLPLFMNLEESAPGEEAENKDRGWFASSFGPLLQTAREIRHYRQIVRFLIARLIFNDGIITVFNFGGIFAAKAFGFTPETLFVFGIALNLAAALGSYLFGILDDRIGSRRTIFFSLVGLSLSSLVALLARDVRAFWVAASFLGFFSGPAQSAARTMLGRFVPPSKESEFYGFFAFSGKATAFFGPLLIGLITDWTQSIRWGFSVVLVFFVMGGFLLLRVDEAEGIRVGRGGALTEIDEIDGKERKRPGGRSKKRKKKKRR